MLDRFDVFADGTGPPGRGGMEPGRRPRLGGWRARRSSIGSRSTATSTRSRHRAGRCSGSRWTVPAACTRVTPATGRWCGSIRRRDRCRATPEDPAGRSSTNPTWRRSAPTARSTSPARGRSGRGSFGSPPGARSRPGRRSSPTTRTAWSSRPTAPPCSSSRAARNASLASRSAATVRPAPRRRSHGSPTPTRTAWRSTPRAPSGRPSTGPTGSYDSRPEGSEVLRIDDHLASVMDAPTNLAWIGPELDRAVVANVGDRYLLVADLGVRGAPLHLPEVA